MPEPTTIIGVAGGMLGLMIHLARHYFELAKEIVDIVLGVLLLVLLAPILGVCAVLIKVASKGPVIFTQVRLGQNGKSFRMYKLRSMHLNAEAASGAVWATRNDPRIIGVCRWMRRSHADELPQLLNVVKGEMSLIGPRPERPEIFAELEKVYPDARKRLAVRPGITGLAQVRNGYDTSVDAFRRKLQSDLEYIEKRKWSTELYIVFNTLGKLNDKQSC